MAHYVCTAVLWRAARAEDKRRHAERITNSDSRISIPSQLPQEDLAMKTAKWFVPAAFAFASIPFLMAQQAGTSTSISSAQSAAAGSTVHGSGNASASAQAGRGRVSGSGTATATGTARVSDARGAASGNAGARGEMRPVSGTLEGKLDSKTAHVGDRVVVKTRAKMTAADGTVIPKGTRLVGHVTAVQAHERGHAESQMSFVFDRAELKSGESFAIHAAIESVEPVANASAEPAMEDEDSFLSPVGGGMAGGGGRAGGGLAGGGGRLLGGGVGQVSNTAVGTGAGLSSGANEAVHSTGHVADGAVDDAGANLSGANVANVNAPGVNVAGANLHGAAGAGGVLTTRATGMPGVLLRSGVSGEASGTLTAAKKNIHLDSGTQMGLSLVTEVRQ
jgi:hypothetical protein